VPPLDPCGYPQHRKHDWRLPESRNAFCGICHPPVPGIEIVQRDSSIDIPRTDVMLARLAAARTRHDL
jgi:hypothetical protein